MTLLLKRQLSQFFWLLTALIAVFYGPMAMEYFAQFYTAAAPKLWLHLFSAVAGERHTLGAGSVEVVQQTVYTKSRLAMLFHTVAGGTAIMLAALQFYTPFRRKYLHLHRTIGRVFISIAVVSMVGAMAFLIQTGPAQSFNGLPFYLQLWILALGTLLSALLAVFAISEGQVQMHQAAMFFCFALLLSAPVLRIEWLIIGGLMGDTVTQQVSNLFSSLIFGYLVVPCVIAASRLTDHRSSPIWPTHQATFRRGDVLIMFAGVLATGLIALNYAAQIKLITGFALCLLLLGVLTLAAYVAAWLTALRAHNALAIIEWRIHILAFFISPIVFLLFWQILSQFSDVYTAFESASFTAPAVTFALGYLLVGVSRKVKRRANVNSSDHNKKAVLSL